jgi:hypothetical protein
MPIRRTTTSSFDEFFRLPTNPSHFGCVGSLTSTVFAP